LIYVFLLDLIGRMFEFGHGKPMPIGMGCICSIY
jgi:hypothetical protein